MQVVFLLIILCLAEVTLAETSVQVKLIMFSHCIVLKNLFLNA